MREAAGLAVAGALLGTLLDFVHVATATTRYRDPVFLGLAWWVPLLFAGAALGIGLSHTTADRVLGRAPRPDPIHVVAGMVMLLALWAASGVVKPARSALAVLVPASLALWWWLDGSAAGLALAAATAACGVVVEATLVSLGAFSYVAPDAGRVASWLPWLYVAASVAVGNFARWLATRAPSSDIRPAR
jgi:hypothetical protein